MDKTELKAKAAHYVKIVELNDEDGCFLGTCPGLMFGACTVVTKPRFMPNCARLWKR